MRLLLILRGYHPDTDPSTVGEYRWMPEHEAYVWEGRALEVDEFNEFFRTWLPRQANIRGIRALDVRAIPAAATTQGSETASRLAHNQETAGATPAPASTAADLAAAAKAKLATTSPAPASRRKT